MFIEVNYKVHVTLPVSDASTAGGTENHMKWQESMERAHNIGECIVAKQRHGPIGTVKMFFDPNFTRFSDLDPNHLSYAGGFGDD